MTKSNTERTLETLVEFADIHRQQMREMGQHFEQSMERVTASIDALAVQVSQLNSGMSEMKGMMRQTIAAIDRQVEAIDRQAESINGHLRVAEAQTSNIAALTRLVEMLTQRN